MQDKFVKVLVRRGPAFEGREIVMIAKPITEEDSMFNHPTNRKSWFEDCAERVGIKLDVEL